MKRMLDLFKHTLFRIVIGPLSPDWCRFTRHQSGCASPILFMTKSRHFMHGILHENDSYGTWACHDRNDSSHIIVHYLLSHLFALYVTLSSQWFTDLQSYTIDSHQHTDTLMLQHWQAFPSQAHPLLVPLQLHDLLWSLNFFLDSIYYENCFSCKRTFRGQPEHWQESHWQSPV